MTKTHLLRIRAESRSTVSTTKIAMSVSVREHNMMVKRTFVQSKDDNAGLKTSLKNLPVIISVVVISTPTRFPPRPIAATSTTPVGPATVATSATAVGVGGVARKVASSAVGMIVFHCGAGCARRCGR